MPHIEGTPARPVADRGGRAAGTQRFRLDIQGLRALAVVSVVLDHSLSWPAGGFVGVDVFFVISGFLITGLLLRELQRTGTISFRGFYGRRLRRIMPAAIVAIAATVAAAAFVTPGAAFRGVAADALAATFSVANWRFAATGTDYFAQTGSTSPLQHFWSLAVEEQFYLVWPLVLLLLFVATRRSEARTRVAVIATALGALLVASFAFSVWQTATQPTVAYFSSLTRFWELGVGGALAVAATRLARLPRRLGVAAGWAGLALLALSLVVVRPGAFFPGPAAALPVLGAALVIAGGSVEGVAGPYLLRNRVATFLGAISYSWYLWHFPVVVFLQGLAVPGARRDLATIVVGLGLACLSYRCVERPMMTSPLLRAEGWRAGAGAVWARWAAGVRMPARAGWATAAIAIVAIIGSVVVVNPAVAARAQGGFAVSIPADLPRSATPGTPAAAIEDDLIAALHASSWPTLHPSAAEAADAGSPKDYDAACSATVIADPTSCSFGKAGAPTIVVFGDSLGITLLPTVVQAYGSRFHVRGLTLAGCAVSDADVVFGDAQGERTCRDMRAAALRSIDATHPVLVLMIENSAWTTRLASGATGERAVAEWRAAVQSSVDAMRGARRVAVVSPSPDTGTGIAQCATPLSTPSACVSTIPAAWRIGHAAESRVHGATYIDTLHWFCVDGVCPAFSGDVPTKRDFVHPTVQYAARLVPDFERMTAALLP